MHRTIIAAFASTSLMLTAGCGTTDRGAAHDSTPGAPAGASAADSGRAGAAAPDRAISDWTVSVRGAGPIAIGMTVDQLRRAVGELTPTPDTAATCTYVRPPGAPPGVSVMLASGVVARVDVDSVGVRTVEGVAVGDTAGLVRAAYPGRTVTTRHKYVPGGEYIEVTPSGVSDSTTALIFEVENGRVSRYRAGRFPEVGLVERCG